MEALIAIIIHIMRRLSDYKKKGDLPRSQRCGTSTRHGLICAAMLTTAPTGSPILPCETSQGMTAFTRALPQGSLYRHAQEGEDANPQSDKNCFNHNYELAAVMPPGRCGAPGGKIPLYNDFMPQKGRSAPKKWTYIRTRKQGALFKRALVVACYSSGP
jgi:hypothetical protein